MKTFFLRDLILGLRAWPLRKPKLPPPLELNPVQLYALQTSLHSLNAPGIAYSHQNPLPQAFPARSKPSFHGQSGSSLEHRGEGGHLYARLGLCRQWIMRGLPSP